MSLLTCHDLAVGYNGHAVLQNLNFEVVQGAYLCIIGANGSGKSTLMRTLLGLQPPLRGTITSSELNALGYVPQQTDTQKDFPASVWEVVLSGRLPRKKAPFYSRIDKSIAEENMLKLGISGLRDKCYRELSGGQQQRTLIARALCATQGTLLLDEPTVGLDPVTTKEFYSLLAELNSIGKVTIIMVTHDLQAVATYASHVLRVGSSCFFGTQEEFQQVGGDVL